MSDGLWGIIFFSLVAISWASLATFVGMAVFLIDLLDEPRIYVYMFASATILVPTTAFLLDQDSYIWVYGLDFTVLDDSRVFHTGNFILNSCFFSGIVLTYMSARYLLPELRSPVRRICLWCLIFAALWGIAGPVGIFLSIGFVPNSEWLASRVIFIAAFLAVSFVTFRWLASVHRWADLTRDQADRGLDKPGATA